MRDYRNCLADFLKHSQNSVSYAPLEQDALRYFAAIPDTSPARYNKPFQNINAFFNWLVSQEYLAKNPLKANGLKKRKDDGNVKPASIEALQSFLKALDRKSYADHSYSYGSWVSDSETQHKRTKTCSACGDSGYEYADHTDTNGDGKCDDCGATVSLTIKWDAGTNAARSTERPALPKP